MTKLRLLLGLSVLLGVGVVGSAAVAAAPPDSATCAGGPIAAGTYNGLTVTGNCFFGGPVTVDGNLKVADGAILNDHAFSRQVVHVTGNVTVGKGAVLGLGAYGPPNIAQTGTVVDGNIIANQPASLYLTAITVHGNVTSNGGGDPERNFPTKNVVVDGNMTIQGWSGLWIGLLRNQVGGNVVFSKNSGTQTGIEEFEGIPDSSEVATNHIGGNLICQGNSPVAQIGDAVIDGGTLNVVGGSKIGECTAV